MAASRRLAAATAGLGLLVAVAACAEEGSVATPTPAAQAAPSSAAPLAASSSVGTTDALSALATTAAATAAPAGPAPAAPPAAPATTAAQPPTAAPFRSTVGTPTAGELHASWHPGCPVPVDDLRVVEVSHLGFDGTVRTGRLVVAAAVADDVVSIMADLYAAEFPIQRMEPVEAYRGSDDESMAANNTSAFNCRAVTGGSSWSEHSYGRAIDVNPLVNPYVLGTLVLPPAGASYTDRTGDSPGMIHAGDEVVSAFEARGWAWGGDWSSPKDYQHFSTSGR